jgi:hypothetical protein
LRVESRCIYWPHPLSHKAQKNTNRQTKPHNLTTNQTNQQVTENFAYLPFGGGRRKCIGDQFALFETLVALAVFARRYDFSLAPGKPEVGMTTGAYAWCVQRQVCQWRVWRCVLCVGGPGGVCRETSTAQSVLCCLRRSLNAGATIHTVAGLWMNVKRRVPPPAAAGGAAAAAAAAHQQQGSSPPAAAPQPVPVGAVAAFDGTGSSSSSSSTGAAAAAPSKCPFSGALTALSSSSSNSEAAPPPAPAV